MIDDSYGCVGCDSFFNAELYPSFDNPNGSDTLLCEDCFNEALRLAAKEERNRRGISPRMFKVSSRRGGESCANPCAPCTLKGFCSKSGIPIDSDNNTGC